MLIISLVECGHNKKQTYFYKNNCNTLLNKLYNSLSVQDVVVLKYGHILEWEVIKSVRSNDFQW